MIATSVVGMGGPPERAGTQVGDASRIRGSPPVPSSSPARGPYNGAVFVLELPGGARVAIRQTAHALLAWQVAAHWGNRRTLRPAPRAEALAAVLLHDSGWIAFDTDPGVDGDGRPVTFDRMPVEVHLEIWRRSVTAALAHARLAGLLVARHHLRLASWKESEHPGDPLVAAFREEIQALAARLEAQLGRDPRYAPALAGPWAAANAAVMAACDRLAVAICAGHEPPFELPAVGRDGEEITVRVTAASDGAWRLRPWPLEGRRLTVHVEGVRLPPGPLDRERLRAALAGGEAVRIVRTLLPPGEPARGR